MIEMGQAVFMFEWSRVCLGGLFFGLVSDINKPGEHPESADQAPACNANKVRVEKTAPARKPESYAEAKDFLAWLHEHEETGAISWVRLVCLYAEFCEVVGKAPRPDNVWPKHLTDLGIKRELKRVSEKGQKLKRMKFYYIDPPGKSYEKHHNVAQLYPETARVGRLKTRVTSQSQGKFAIKTRVGTERVAGAYL